MTAPGVHPAVDKSLHILLISLLEFGVCNWVEGMSYWWVKVYLRLPRMCAGFGVISWLLRDRDEGNDEGNQRHCFWVSCDPAPAARRSSIQFYQPRHGWRFIMDLVTFDSYLQCCGFSPFYFLNMVEVEMRLALDTLMIYHLKVDIDYYDLLTKYVILKIDICYFY